jgi:hypothetical protein
MQMSVLWGWMLLLAWSAVGAERKFDFSQTPENQTPAGFRSTVAGHGKPGEWKVILVDVPPVLAPLTPNATVSSKRAVLAQLAEDPTDEHFPLLIFEPETFADFTLTTRFKTVGGKKEQMAGIAFRIQNETNYYVVRASSLGNTFRFYKVVNGQRGNLIGPETPIPSGVWHEMRVECKANQIRCSLDGQDLIPPLTDNSFGSGKIGFWTKSDSVTYFSETKIVYTPRDIPAQAIVREMVQKYPRLVGLRIYVAGTEAGSSRVVGSKEEAEIGQAGGKTEQDVINQGSVYYGKGDKTVSVTMPLRDRNGEIIAAGRVVMKSFAGQTEQNAVARALPIVREMQRRIQSPDDLLQ